jgi:hypothetical protein
VGGLTDFLAARFGLRVPIGPPQLTRQVVRACITIGYRVFVRDNLAFHGDLQKDESICARHRCPKLMRMSYARITVDPQRMGGFRASAACVSRWR